MKMKFFTHFKIAKLMAFVLLCANAVKSQTVIYTETFNTGGAGWTLNTSDAGSDPGNANLWIINNSYAGLPPLIANTPNQFIPIVGAPNSTYLHIHNTVVATLAGVTNSNFESSNSGNVFARMSNSISTVGFTGVSLKFWHLVVGDNSSTNSFFGRVYYSTNGGTNWTQLPNTFSQIPNWTQATITNAAFDNQPSLMFGFQWVQNPPGIVAADPAFSIDDIVVEGTSGGGSNPTITTGTINPTVYCAGDQITVPFSTTGTFNAGNNFSVELSDASGSFAAPTVIGTGTTSPITATIPGGTAAGTNYQIRVVASNPSTTGTASTSIITINQPQTLSVSLTADVTNICPNQSVTFTATPSPSTLTNANYEWFIGGVSQGPPSANNTFTTTNIATTSNVTVTITSTDNCLTSNNATSNAVEINAGAQTLTVNVTPSATSICPNQSITFTATVSPNLSDATFQWFIGGATQGPPGASNTFTTTSLTTDASITVQVTTADPCVSPQQIISTPVLITVGTQTLSVSITVSPDNTPCPGDELTFTANVTPAGATGLSYQWQINNVDVPGQNLSTFVTTNYQNNDVVRCVVTTSDPCFVNSTVNSNLITITFETGSPVTVAATASPSSVCEGADITFTATITNGGQNPTFQWYRNGTLIGNTNPFTTNAIQPGDAVSVVGITSETCTSNLSDSISVPVTVIENVVPSISLSRERNLCTNSTGLLNATINPSGGSISWFSDGVQVGGAGTQLEVTQAMQNTSITATYSNIPGCVTTTTTNSNSVAITLFNSPTVNLGSDVEMTYAQPVDITPSFSANNLLVSFSPSTIVTCATANCSSLTLNPTDSLNFLIAFVRDPVNGCFNSDTLVIKVKPNYEIFIPSAFSPNGDGFNDVLYVRNPPDQFKKGNFLFRVFNEYGEMVFESFSQEYGWDGFLRDKPALLGVYMYYASGLYVDGRAFEKTGKVILMR